MSISQPTPERKAPLKLPTRPEEDEQRAVAQYLDMRRDLVWCHVGNGGMRNRAEGGKLKAQGVKAGVPDILIFNATKEGHVGTAIELKRRDGGKLTIGQMEWLCNLKKNRWATALCHGSDEAIEVLKRLYG